MDRSLTVDQSHKEKMTMNKDKYDSNVKKEPVETIVHDAPRNFLEEPLEKPTYCRTLADYFKHDVLAAQERSYLLQQVQSWKFPLGEKTWQDGMSLLGLSDGDVSSSWVQKVFEAWQGDLSQPDWLRTALTETVLHLQYYQPGVLSAGGALKIMEGMLDWLETIEEKLGSIPASAEEAWRSILVIISLLTQTFGVGVSQTVFEQLKTTLFKLSFNLNKDSLKKPYKVINKTIKKHEKQRKLLGKTIDSVSKQDKLGKVEVSRIEKEITQLDDTIMTLKGEAASTTYMRLKRLVSVLEANVACLSIARTRTQKWQKRCDAVKNLFDILTSAVTGVTTAAVGSVALLGVIAAVPSTYGAAALALIPAVAAFSGGVVSAGGQLVGAAHSSGKTAMGLYYLHHKPHYHPINELLAHKTDGNLLYEITSRYLEGDIGHERVKSTLIGKDSWYLIQFLNQLFLHVGGAIGLSEEYKVPTILQMATLLKALYQSHSHKKHALDKAVCEEVIYLSQALQRECGWSLFDKKPEETWVMTYEKAGWLMASSDKSDMSIEGESRIRLNEAIAVYETAIAKKATGEPMLLPWDSWFEDKEVEHLGNLCQAYEAGDVSDSTLKEAFNTVDAQVRTTRQRLEEKGGVPLLSTWGLQQAEALVDQYREKMNKLIDLNKVMKEIESIKKLFEQKSYSPGFWQSSQGDMISEAMDRTQCETLLERYDMLQPSLKIKLIDALKSIANGDFGDKGSGVHRRPDFVFSNIHGGRDVNLEVDAKSAIAENITAVRDVAMRLTDKVLDLVGAYERVSKMTGAVQADALLRLNAKLDVQKANDEKQQALQQTIAQRLLGLLDKEVTKLTENTKEELPVGKSPAPTLS
ncbi:MAG: hypothetical protein ACX932_05420 [Gammaproteobacteria bacterium]